MSHRSLDLQNIFERTFDAVPDLIAILDKDHRILRANRAMADRLGKEPRELIGQFCYRVIHGTDGPPDFCPHARLMKDGMPTTSEVHEDRLGGDFLISVIPLLNEKGKLGGSVHVARDISEFKKAQMALKEANISLEDKIRERTRELSLAIAELERENEEHRLTEKKLRETELHYKTVADFAYGWEFWVDQNDSYLYCSPSSERITGYRPEEFLANPGLFPEIILPEDRAVWEGHWHSAPRDHALSEINLRIRTKAGDIRWIEHACQPVLGPKGEFLGYRASNRDITLAKDAEEALRLSESRLAEAQKIARLGNWDWDISDNNLYWSDEIYRIFGLKPREFGATYEAFLERVHAEDRDMVVHAVDQALYNNQNYSIDHRIVLADGCVRIVHEQAQIIFNEEGKPVRMIGTVQDITEQKNVEHELEDRLGYERLYAEMSASLGNVPLNELDTAIKQSLERLVEYFDVDRVTILELNEDRSKLTPLMSCAVPGVEPYMRTDSDRLFPWVFKKLSLGQTLVWDRVLEKLPPEASSDRKYVQSIGIKSYISIPLTLGGKTDYAIAMGTFGKPREWPEQLIQRLRHLGEMFAHVLVRRRVENRVRQLRGQLTSMTRVTTMGELAGALAHEINQPLAAIMSNAQAARRFLEAKEPDIEELRDILTDIADDTTRASEVIQRLRNMMKGSRATEVPLSINDVIQEVIPLMKRDSESREVRIQLELSPDLPPVRGDKIQLQQILLNLLLNGFDAMRELEPLQRVLTIETSPADDNKVRVAVRDVGTGIEDEKLQQIFDPFFTTKSEGMGLGLSINRTIVEAHGGQLWAENNQGAGATFYFTLPAHEGGKDG